MRKRYQFGIRLTEKQRRELEAEAKANRRSMADQVAVWIEEALAARKGRK
jgi:hypothetical protein